MTQPSARYEIVEFTDLTSARTWLEANHATSPGIWAVTGKKNSSTYIAYPDLVRETLRVGWIDSKPRAVDELHTSRLLTPRTPTSAWSRVNKAHIEALEQAGDLHSSGRAAVNNAMHNGAWTSLDAVEDLLEPPELSQALDNDVVARSNWDAFPRSAKRAILEWINQAKTATTRANRIDQTATEASAGRRANQWRKPKTS